jgi:RNA 3'-terminal phosphate cyclase (ATP)
MITIDGSTGEGGGQILRSALALSLCTAQPFRITEIRAGRRKPGLMRQHLTSVIAAAAIGSADVVGAEVGSRELTFVPGKVQPGVYHFAVGTAGSTMLVLQAILPPLLTADGPSRLTLEGGTHALAAPPFEFIQRAFLPLINRMGPQVEARLERHGFYPAGGGRVVVNVTPARELAPLEIPQRGEIVSRRATALLSQLPGHIAQRELQIVREILGWDESECHIRTPPAALPGAGAQRPAGPGNAVLLEIESQYITEVLTALGQVGKPAEEVAREAAQEAHAYLAAGVPVGPHLADQLLLPMALAGRGSFATLPPSAHTITNAEVIRRFLDLNVQIEGDGVSIG